MNEKIMKGIVASMAGMLLMACAACGGGGGGGGGPAQSQTASAPKQAVAVTVEQYGDSTTLGCTVTAGAKANDQCPADGYAVAPITESQALQTALTQLGSNATVVNKGVSSTTADDLLNGTGRANGQTWEASMSASKAQIVTVNMGLNDAGSASEDFAGNLLKIVNIARAHGKTVILYTPNPKITPDSAQNDRLVQLRNQIIQTGSAMNVAVVDNYSIMTVQQWQAILPDGIHPTVAGYQAKATNEAPVVASVVKSIS